MNRVEFLFSRIFVFILIFSVFILSGFLFYSYDPFTENQLEVQGNFWHNLSTIIKDKKDQRLLKNEHLLILVNSDNPLPESYFTWFSIVEGHVVSKSMEKDLIQMLAVARKEGVPLKLNSTYRSIIEQQELFESRVHSLLEQGYEREIAEFEVGKQVSRAGYSEHHTGLAIDFSNPGHYRENEQMWNWLAQNAFQYGFILRYPEDKENITKTSYEPWHYRYVGREDSAVIMENDLVLEEYIMGS